VCTVVFTRGSATANRLRFSICLDPRREHVVKILAAEASPSWTGNMGDSPEIRPSPTWVGEGLHVYTPHRRKNTVKNTWNVSLQADLRTPDTTLCSFKRYLKGQPVSVVYAAEAYGAAQHRSYGAVNDNDNDNDKRLGLTAKADQPGHKNNTVH